MKVKLKNQIRERTERAIAWLEPEVADENVTPLNPGVFLLERIRATKRAKLKDTKRAPLKAQK